MIRAQLGDHPVLPMCPSSTPRRAILGLVTKL